jgi:flagellar basal-body rod protein FlgC
MAMNAITTALSGLMANTMQLEASASNVANARSSGPLAGADWGPATTVDLGRPPDAPPAAYRPVTVMSSATEQGGVLARTVAVDPATVPAYDPQSPFASADGLVAMPNVDFAREAVSQMMARQSFQANLNTIRTADEMQRSLLSVV